MQVFCGNSLAVFRRISWRGTCGCSKCFGTWEGHELNQGVIFGVKPSSCYHSRKRVKNLTVTRSLMLSFRTFLSRERIHQVRAIKTSATAHRPIRRRPPFGGSQQMLDLISLPSASNFFRIHLSCHTLLPPY
jgi:hypothetical protein